MDVDMNPTPPKVIGKAVCLQAKGLFGLSKDLGPKKCQNSWKAKKSKEIKDFMKVENGSVHHKKFNGQCIKQQIRLPKVNWTSPILRRRVTCWRSCSRASLMRNDVKVEMPNGTPNTLIPSMGW